eukprot:348128_1
MSCIKIVYLVAIILCVTDSQFPGYADLSTTLPTTWTDPITAIYQDKLYVLGNGTFFTLELSTLGITLNAEQNDIASQNVGIWNEINIAWPTYGDSNDQFSCSHQCSVVIGHYLFIVGPQKTTCVEPTCTWTYPSYNYMYRLDLSQNPPEFASDTEFQSNLSYTASKVYDMCVTTDGTDLYYISGRINGPEFSLESWKYIVSTDTHVRLMDVDRGRQRASCVFNIDKTKIFLFGGRGLSPYTFGVTGVDYYDIYANTWTNTSYDPYKQLYRKDRWKCFNIPNQNLIECPTGQSNAGTMQESIIWDTETQNITQVITNITAVREYGLALYEINNNVTIVLLLGGISSTTTRYDTIQYTIRTSVYTSDCSGDIFALSKISTDSNNNKYLLRINMNSEEVTILNAFFTSLSMGGVSINDVNHVVSNQLGNNIETLSTVTGELLYSTIIQSNVNQTNFGNIQYDTKTGKLITMYKNPHTQQRYVAYLDITNGIISEIITTDACGLINSARTIDTQQARFYFVGTHCVESGTWLYTVDLNVKTFTKTILSSNSLTQIRFASGIIYTLSKTIPNSTSKTLAIIDPLTGTISSVDINAAEFASVSNDIMTIDNFNGFYIKGSLNQLDVLNLVNGELIETITLTDVTSIVRVFYDPICIPTATNAPTKYPSSNPSKLPSSNPSVFPSKNPSENPSENPSTNPTKNPSENPSINPITFLSENPSIPPTTTTISCETDDNCPEDWSCKYSSVSCFASTSSQFDCIGYCVEDDNYCLNTDLENQSKSWKHFLNDNTQCSLCFCKQIGARICATIYTVFKDKQLWKDKLDEICPYTTYEKLEDNGEQCKFEDIRLIKDPPDMCDCNAIKCVSSQIVGNQANKFNMVTVSVMITIICGLM